MSRLHTVRSLMCAGLVSVVPGALLAGITARVASAKLPGDFGSPRGEPTHAVLTNPPPVPSPTSRTYSAKVIVELEVIKKEVQISEGVSYTFWTFGGIVPGSFIRVRQDDMTEFHLKSHPGSKVPHNIDLHGIIGLGGGAASSFIAPGHEPQFTFRALNEGIYVYHCATAPVGIHIANDIYGLILVEPPEDLPKVDYEYYAMRDDFCTVGKYHEKDLQPSDMEKAIDKYPSYVLFNGAEGALTDDRALHTKVGETMCIFVDDGGPSLVSSFHVIGATFDQVCYEGDTNIQKNVQTTLISTGSAAVVKFTVRVSDSYVLVDRSIFRIFDKGAMAILETDGAENKLVYSGKELDLIYLGDRVTPNMSAVIKATQASVNGTLTVQDQVQVGRALLAGTCSVCRQGSGAELLGVFPPLVKSDFLAADPKHAMDIVLHSPNGRIKANGQEYDSVTPSMAQLNDDEVINVLTYVFNSWDNLGDRVSAENIKRVHAQPMPTKAMAEH